MSMTGHRTGAFELRMNVVRRDQPKVLSMLGERCSRANITLYEFATKA